MIRINLLKGKQGRLERPRGGMGKIILIALIVIAAGAGGGAFWMFRAEIFRLMPVPALKKESVAQQESASSPYPGEGMVAEVVKQVSDAGRKLSGDGMLSLPYEELSFSKKINYEVLFAKNMAELLARTVPAGIGLRSLESDNFQTIYAVGIAPSKELVQGMFTSLMDKKVTLLPKPFTLITPNSGKGFKFAFTGKAEFGLNLTDPIMDAPFMADRDLPLVLAAMERCARENAITSVKRPVKVSSEKVGAYDRHLYQWTGQGSYKNFVRFVLCLYQTRQFCAFKRVSVSALSGASVKIELQVLITTRQ